MYGALIDISLHAINTNVNYTRKFARQCLDSSKWRVLHLHKRPTFRSFKIFLLPFVCFLLFCHITNHLICTYRLGSELTILCSVAFFSCLLSKLRNTGHYVIATNQSGKITIEPKNIGHFVIAKTQSGKNTIELKNIGHYVIITTQSGKINIEPKNIGHYVIVTTQTEKITIEPKILVTSSSLQLRPGRLSSKPKNTGHYVIATTQTGKITI